MTILHILLLLAQLAFYAYLMVLTVVLAVCLALAPPYLVFVAWRHRRGATLARAGPSATR